MKTNFGRSEAAVHEIGKMRAERQLVRMAAMVAGLGTVAAGPGALHKAEGILGNIAASQRNLAARLDRLEVRRANERIRARAR